MNPQLLNTAAPYSYLSAAQLPDITGLEELLLTPAKILRSVPALEMRKFTQLQRQVFCYKYGFYQLLTDELVDFLRGEIAGQRALEIGAGNGGLGPQLPGLVCTDSFVQQDDLLIRAHYARLGVVPVAYGAHVHKCEALHAVKTLTPQVVIGCWVTEYGLSGPTFMHGVDEVAMLKPELGVQKYLMVGNKSVHGQKSMLKTKWLQPKQWVNPSWLFSRASKPEDNVIYRLTRR